jgi:hypothetical protein
MERIEWLRQAPLCRHQEMLKVYDAILKGVQGGRIKGILSAIDQSCVEEKMKRVSVLTIALLLSFGFFIVAHAEEMNWELKTGNDMVRMSDAVKRVQDGKANENDLGYMLAYVSYVIGFSLGLQYAGDLSVPHNASNQQLFDVVDKYLREHPEMWSMHPSDIMYKALTEAYPQ